MKGEKPAEDIEGQIMGGLTVRKEPVNKEPATEDIEEQIIGVSTVAKEPSKEELDGLIRLAEDDIAESRKKEVEAISKWVVSIISNSLKQNNESISEEECDALIEVLKLPITEYSEKLLETAEKEEQLSNKLAPYLPKEYGPHFRELISDAGLWVAKKAIRDADAAEISHIKDALKLKK